MAKVMVSGCFDLLHPGHVAFLEDCAKLGDLLVCVARDDTVWKLKGIAPQVPETDRLAMVAALRCVSKCWLAPEVGWLDFLPLLSRERPDIFAVNPDCDREEKRATVESWGVEYRVMPGRHGPWSSTDLRAGCRIPYRVDLAGAWLDQPFVSLIHPGSVIVASIEPTRSFPERSGLAVSTRNVAKGLWGRRLPLMPELDAARLLFAADNPPGKSYVSGSQDALGICLRGINRLDYNGGYWPCRVQPCEDRSVLDWLEQRLWLAVSPPRPDGLDVLQQRCLLSWRVSQFATTVERVWGALLACEEQELIRSISDCSKAQLSLFPLMATPELLERSQATNIGVVMQGAGGGGYMLLVSKEQPPDSIPVTIRREGAYGTA